MLLFLFAILHEVLYTRQEIDRKQQYTDGSDDISVQNDTKIRFPNLINFRECVVPIKKSDPQALSCWTFCRQILCWLRSLHILFIAVRGAITFDKSLFKTSVDDLLVHRFTFAHGMSSLATEE